MVGRGTGERRKQLQARSYAHTSAGGQDRAQCPYLDGILPGPPHPGRSDQIQTFFPSSLFLRSTVGNSKAEKPRQLHQGVSERKSARGGRSVCCRAWSRNATSGTRRPLPLSAEQHVHPRAPVTPDAAPGSGVHRPARSHRARQRTPGAAAGPAYVRGRGENL